MKRTTLHDAYAGIGRGVKKLRKENEELRARITALETAGHKFLQVNDPTYSPLKKGEWMTAYKALAALLGETK